MAAHHQFLPTADEPAAEIPIAAAGWLVDRAALVSAGAAYVFALILNNNPNQEIAMAYSGVHVVCAFAGSSGQRHLSQSIIGKILWSETPASGVATTNAAPQSADIAGQPFFRIHAAADAWVSIGKSPDATNGTRFRVPAGDMYDIFADFGDKLQWVAA